MTIDPAADEPAPPAVEGPPVLVWDAEAAFAATAGGVDAVHAALDGAWLAVRPVATATMTARGGKLLLLAPRPGTSHHAAARAGLENLSRTLGIEWARFGIRTVTILPGEGTDATIVGELAAFLASPAGNYFSGCALTLDAVRGAEPAQLSS